MASRWEGFGAPEGAIELTQAMQQERKIEPPAVIHSDGQMKLKCM
jgi:hypothetical protein